MVLNKSQLLFDYFLHLKMFATIREILRWQPQLKHTPLPPHHNRCKNCKIGLRIQENVLQWIVRIIQNSWLHQGILMSMFMSNTFHHWGHPIEKNRSRIQDVERNANQWTCPFLFLKSFPDDTVCVENVEEKDEIFSYWCLMYLCLSGVWLWEQRWAISCFLWPRWINWTVSMRVVSMKILLCLFH